MNFQLYDIIYTYALICMHIEITGCIEMTANHILNETIVGFFDNDNKYSNNSNHIKVPFFKTYSLEKGQFDNINEGMYWN